MVELHPITSLDLPELAPYRTLKRPYDHEARQIFVAEGGKIVRRLLQSAFPVLSILCTPDWLERLRPELEPRAELIPIYVAPQELLEELTGYAMWQGVQALGKIPETPSLQDVLHRTAPPRLFAAIDGIDNAENLGVIVRNCAAFRVQALIVGETSGSPYLRRAVRSSMGTIFRLPIVEVSSLQEALGQLRAAGVLCVATQPRATVRPLFHSALLEDCCLVFGNEAHGIRPQILAACDERLAIPMAPEVDSLNVGSATAVFFYEVLRQRASPAQ